MVDVVARLDDQPVADPEYEDTGHPERLAGRDHGAGVVELRDDHLRVLGLVDPDVVRLVTHHPGDPRTGAAEVLPQRLAAEQRLVPVRRHRVPDVGLLGVQRGQGLEVAVGDAVDQAQEDLSWSHRFLLQAKRSSDYEYTE